MQAETERIYLLLTLQIEGRPLASFPALSLRVENHPFHRKFHFTMSVGASAVIAVWVSKSWHLVYGTVEGAPSLKLVRVRRITREAYLRILDRKVGHGQGVR